MKSQVLKGLRFPRPIWSHRIGKNCAVSASIATVARPADDASAARSKTMGQGENTAAPAAMEASANVLPVQAGQGFKKRPTTL